MEAGVRAKPLEPTEGKTAEEDRQKIVRKTFKQILMSKDPACSKESLDKFLRLQNEILQALKIEDDRENNVENLMKIESRLNQLCEVRNFMVARDYREAKKGVRLEKTIEQYEKDLQKERMDKIVKEKQNEQKQ